MQCCTALKSSLESQQGDQNKEDHHEFEDSVDYIVSSRPAWAMGGNNQRERERGCLQYLYFYGCGKCFLHLFLFLALGFWQNDDLSCF